MNEFMNSVWVTARLLPHVTAYQRLVRLKKSCMLQFAMLIRFIFTLLSL